MSLARQLVEVETPKKALRGVANTLSNDPIERVVAASGFRKEGERQWTKLTGPHAKLVVKGLVKPGGGINWWFSSYDTSTTYRSLIPLTSLFIHGPSHMRRLMGIYEAETPKKALHQFSNAGPGSMTVVVTCYFEDGTAESVRVPIVWEPDEILVGDGWIPGPKLWHAKTPPMRRLSYDQWSEQLATVQYHLAEGPNNEDEIDYRELHGPDFEGPVVKVHWRVFGGDLHKTYEYFSKYKLTPTEEMQRRVRAQRERRGRNA